MNFTLRQLDLLSTRADCVNPGPCRDSLVRRIEQLNVAHHLILAKLAATELNVESLSIVRELRFE